MHLLAVCDLFVYFCISVARTLSHNPCLCLISGGVRHIIRSIGLCLSLTVTSVEFFCFSFSSLSSLSQSISVRATVGGPEQTHQSRCICVCLGGCLTGPRKASICHSVFYLTYWTQPNYRSVDDTRTLVFEKFMDGLSGCQPRREVKERNWKSIKVSSRSIKFTVTHSWECHCHCSVLSAHASVDTSGSLSNISKFSMFELWNFKIIYLVNDQVCNSQCESPTGFLGCLLLKNIFPTRWIKSICAVCANGKLPFSTTKDWEGFAFAARDISDTATGRVRMCVCFGLFLSVSPSVDYECCLWARNPFCACFFCMNGCFCLPLLTFGAGNDF